MSRVFADLNKNDGSRIILTCLGTHLDLENHGISLRAGLELVFYDNDFDEFGNDDNLIFKGTVERDDERDCWIARIDWDQIKSESKLSADEKRELGLS